MGRGVNGPRKPASTTGGWTVGYGALVAVFAGCLLLLGTNRVFSLGL